jgi:hypothetical protein
MSFPKTTADARIALTQSEINALQAMVDAGDRAGFYLAYYAMTGNPEALLTAKVSTFSETVGGAAFASNRFLQDVYSTTPPANSPTYSGIYYLSQEVAKASLAAILADLNGTGASGPRFDGTADGLASPNRLFISAFDGWTGEYLMWPGNFLITMNSLIPGKDYSVPDLSAQAAVNSVGFDAAAKAIMFASALGSDRAI